MITITKQDIKKIRSNTSRSDLNKYLVDKNEFMESTQRLWFKGSRYR